MKLNLTNLTAGSANISANINVAAIEGGKLSAHITVNRNINLPNNPNTTSASETYNYTETPVDLITKIDNDLGLGILVE
jgi:hypothetical protein